MSEHQVFSKILTVEDKRMDFNQSQAYIAELGGAQTSVQFLTFPANTFGSSSVNTSFPNNLGIIRQTFMIFNGTATFRAAAIDAGPIVKPGGFGLSQNAFYKLVTSIQLQIANTTSLWSNVNITVDMVNSMRRSAYSDWSYWSSDAQMQDNCTDYNSLYLTPKNVLGEYWTQSVTQQQCTRASHIKLLVNPSLGAGVQGDVVFSFNLSCPLPMSPLVTKNADAICLVRPQSINLTINFASNFDNFVSINQALTTFVPNSLSILTSNLYWAYSVIDVSSHGHIPLQVVDAYQWDMRSQAIANPKVAGTIETVSMNQVTFNQAPELIAVAVRPVFSARTPSSTTCYAAPVGQVQINYLVPNALQIPSGFPRLNYQMAFFNGLNVDYPTFIGEDVGFGVGGGQYPAAPITLAGGFMVFNAARDLQAAKIVSQIAGTSAPNGGYTFSSSIEVKFPKDGFYEIIILPLYPQVMVEVSEGNYQLQNIDVHGKIVEPIEGYTNWQSLLARSDIYSGGSFSSFLKSLAKGAKTALGYVAPVLNASKEIGRVIHGIPGVGGKAKLLNKYRHMLRGGNISEELIDEMLGSGLVEKEIDELFQETLDSDDFVDSKPVTRRELQRNASMRSKLRQ